MHPVAKEKGANAPPSRIHEISRLTEELQAHFMEHAESLLGKDPDLLARYLRLAHRTPI